MAAASSSNARTMAELVAAIRAAPGRFAVLAGAGISNSAGIMTGDDWLHAQAARDGLDTGLQPVAWYRETYGSFPNYFRMLHEAAGLRTVRDVLPREYFTSATGGDHQPTPSHRALAELAVTGRIGPILTTNFDRLLEKAIVEAGASPTVALSLDSFTEMSSSSLPNCLVVKLHGDYLDIKIRDTSPSIYTYHPIIDTLLDQILGRFDLIVCGWSASWDMALGRALGRPANRRRTFWLLRGTASVEAARLITLRRAHVIPVPGSDVGLSQLFRALA